MNQKSNNDPMAVAMKQIEGFPLKIVSKIQGMEIECIELKRTPLSQSDFEIPIGYTKTSN